MKLSDLAGVFSRYFVVAFFVPAFFGMAALEVLATPQLLPDVYEQYAAGTRLLILGGLAIPVGMLLQGFQPALLSGLVQHRSGADGYRFVPGWLYELMLKPGRRGFKRLRRLSDDSSAPTSPRAYVQAARMFGRIPGRRRPAESAARQAAATQLRRQTQTIAASRLEQRYPADVDDIVPTQLGNTLLATQGYAFSRWGLDTWSAWPRLEGLLSEQERSAISDSKAEMGFFLNSALVATAVGIVLVVDEIWHRPLRPAFGVIYVVPFLAAYLLYRLSIGAAVRWGQYERAAVDLHRLELFKKLGFTGPKTPTEQYRLARALNRFMTYRAPEAATTDANEPLLGLTMAADARGLQPLSSRDEGELRRLSWAPATAADRVWLETDCVLYGGAFATTQGERVDPREVVVDQGGIPWRVSATTTFSWTATVGDADVEPPMS